jgi:SAM-dependent methyltransferase
VRARWAQRLVAGVDISAPMLAVARARAHSAQADIPFIEADASVHDFQPTFDLVFLALRRDVLRRSAAAFANIHKAVAPKGRLAFVCWRVDAGEHLGGGAVRRGEASVAAAGGARSIRARDRSPSPTEPD